MYECRIATQLGKAWDQWRCTKETSGYLWFIEQGGIRSLAVSYNNPSDNGSGGDHSLLSGQDVGWLSREQFMARMVPLAQIVSLLDKDGN